MMVGYPSSPYVHSYIESGERFNLDYKVLYGDELERKFPFFNFLPSEKGVYSKTRAGYLSPRNIARVSDI